MARNEQNAITNVSINDQNASTVLDQLKQKADSYRRAMTEANKANDLTGYKKAEAELKKTERTMTSLKKATFDVNQVMKNLSTTSMNDLTRTQRQLQAELKKTTRGTAEYIEKSKQLRLVSAELRKVKVEMTGVAGSQQGMLNRVASGFNRFGGMALGAIAAVTGVGLGLRKLAQDADAYNAKVAELSAITGLAGEELNWLSEEAKKLSVSTTEDGIRITRSADEIVDAFKLMGSAKPELLENKEALAAVTTEALKLAEAAKMDTAVAVESLANVMNQFGADASQASDYINVLAAGSKFGAAAVDQIATSIIKFGPAAASANISVEESVGLIETLAEKGVKGEIAGTQLRTALLKLQTGADEFNPKVVGLNKALENLKNENLSAAEIVKIFGQEAYTAGAILIENADRVDHFTQSVTDTNIATEQAIINTETNSAALEQARNRFKLAAMELGQRLSPAFRGVTVTAGTLTKVLIALVKFLDQYGKYIVIAVAGITAYTIAVKAQVIWTNIVTAATWLSQKAMLAFNAATKANPIGLVVGLLAAAAAAFAIFRNKADDASASQKKLNEAIKEFDELMKDTRSIEERMRTIEDLNKRQLNTLKNDLKQQIEAHEDNAAKMDVLIAKNTERIEKNNEGIKLSRENINNATSEETKKFYQNQLDQTIAFYNQEFVSRKNSNNKSIVQLKEYLSAVMLNIKNFQENDTTEKSYDDLLEALEELNKKRRLEIHRDYLQQKIDKEKFDWELQLQEIAHLEALLALRRKFGEDTYDTEFKLTQERIKLMEKIDASIQKSIDDQVKLNIEKFDNEKYIDENLKATENFLDEEYKLWKDENDRLAQLDKEALERKIQEAEQYRAITDNLAASVGDLLGRMATDTEMTAQEVAKNLLLIALDSAHGIARMAIAEIWARSLASAESVATWGAAGVAKALAISALVEAAFTGLKAAVSSVGQRYAGKYDVIGEDDGRLYSNVPYRGSMKTGIYSRPTLVAERGSELVVDAGTLRNMSVNFPDVLPKIRASMVPQRAEGNVATHYATRNSQPETQNPQPVDPEIKNLLKLLYQQLSKPLQASMSYGHWKTQTEKAQRIENMASRNP